MVWGYCDAKPDTRRDVGDPPNIQALIRCVWVHYWSDYPQEALGQKGGPSPIDPFHDL